MGLINFGLWISALKDPRTTFAKEKTNASLTEALKNIVVAGFILGVLSAILILVSTTAAAGGFGAVFGGIAALFIIFVLPVLMLVLLLILSGIYWIIAKVLGGKGKYETQTYIISLFLAPLMIISILSNVMILLSLDFVGQIISTLIFLYFVYLLILTFKEVHEYGLGKAIATWAIPMLVAVLLSFGTILAVLGLVATV